MKNRLLLSASIALLIATSGSAQTTRPYSLLNAEALAEMKAKVQGGELKTAVDALRQRCDRLLTEKPPSVMEKPDPLPVEGDRHDYMSLARYFWPDPSKPNGLPYMSKDGESNEKEIALYDTDRKDKMCFAVRDLALAYHLTGEEKYAEGAAKYLRVWFLDEATKMNPNMNHGQFVPGATPGRGFGIIEMRWLVTVTDAVRLLEASPAWPKADDEALRNWFGQYVDWMQTSKIGQEEYNTKNNHGQWFDAQLTGLANFLGRTDVVEKVAAEEGPRRIAKQEKPDGSLPEEIRRTRSLHYSMFAVQPWMQVAKIARANHTAVDVYAWTTDDGRGIRKALEYLAPFLMGEKEWPGQQIGSRNYSEYAGMWREAAKIYDEPKFEAVAKKLKPQESETNLNERLGW